MCEDGGLIGYGMAPAVYVVPVGGAQPREATGRAVGPVMSSARGADRAGDHPRSCAARCPAGAAARGADPLKQEGVTRARPDDRGTARRPVRRVRGENVTGAHADRPAYRYRIRVRGHLGETLRSAFPALQARASGGDTVLTGPLPDRAALYGVLAQLEPERLELLEVRRLPPA